MGRRFLVGIAVSAALNSAADAGYTISLESGGANNATVQPGQSFSLDVVLASSAGDVHNSAIFRVVFSAPGLVYDSYSWSAPYVAGSIFDDSTPFASALPVTLDDLALAGPGYPAGVVDVELSNVTAGSFGQGLLATLHLTVPVDYAGPAIQIIDIVPDTFAHGFDIVDTSPGTGFQLIIPAPPALALPALLGGAARRRRRR